MLERIKLNELLWACGSFWAISCYFINGPAIFLYIGAWSICLGPFFYFIKKDCNKIGETLFNGPIDKQ